MKEQDCLRRFLFEDLGIRGEWVHLHKSWIESKQNQSLSIEVQEQLGQALAAVVLLSATIKFDGSMILQAQGDGALKTLVAQSTHNRKIHGLARASSKVLTGTLSEIMGKGRVVITVAPSTGEPYQGVVPLEGDNLSTAITQYFLQSEQLETHVCLFANETDAAGLLIQQLPTKNNATVDQEDWARISSLAETVTKEEILKLDCETMLFRLFNEEKVNLFKSETIHHACPCSLQKIKVTLTTLGREELEIILQTRETIDVDCEFCGKRYSFNKIDVVNLLSGQTSTNNSKVQH